MDLRKSYWKTHLKYIIILMAIWFVFGLGFSVLITDVLNQFKFAGFPIGFWFAMQGSIIVFVVLLFVYMRLMNKLDEKYQLGDE